MAVSFHAVATSGGSTTAATSGTCTSLVVTAGDVILVCIATITTTISQVTDTSSNIYTPCTTFVNTGTTSCQIWKALAKTTTTITTITATFGNSRWSMVAASYSGVLQTGGFAGTNTGSASPATGQNVIEDPNNFFILGGSARGTVTYTANTGNLRTSRAGGGTTSPGAFIADNTSASGGATVTVSVNLSSSASWGTTEVELFNVPKLETWHVGQINPPALQEPIEIVEY